MGRERYDLHAESKEATNGLIGLSARLNHLAIGGQSRMSCAKVSAIDDERTYDSDIGENGFEVIEIVGKNEDVVWGKLAARTCAVTGADYILGEIVYSYACVNFENGVFSARVDAATVSHPMDPPATAMCRYEPGAPATLPSGELTLATTDVTDTRVSAGVWSTDLGVGGNRSGGDFFFSGYVVLSDRCLGTFSVALAGPLHTTPALALRPATAQSIGVAVSWSQSCDGAPATIWSATQGSLGVTVHADGRVDLALESLPFTATQDVPGGATGPRAFTLSAHATQVPVD